MLLSSVVSTLSGTRFLEKDLQRFANIPFSELAEIYTEVMQSSFTPLYFEALIEIYNERNEFNNIQLLIEG